MSDPNFSAPSAKKTRPVKIELIAYERIVVAMTAFGLESPMVCRMVKAILWKNGTTSIFEDSACVH